MPSVSSTARARRNAAIALAVLLTVAAGALRAGASTPSRSNSAAQPVSAAPGGGAMRTWMAANMAGGFQASASQAAQLAREYNVIVGNPGQFDGVVGVMKASNPNLVLYAYLNGTYSGAGDNDPASWYAHDARGGHVVSRGFGNILMDPTSPGWIGNRASTCQAELASSGYDGCFLDMLGPATMDIGYDNALPINPSNGRTWALSDWLRATGALASQVRAISRVRVIGNGLASGNAFYDPKAPSSLMLQGIDGGSAEVWMRTANASVSSYPNLALWKQNVDMLSANPSTSILTITKTWTGGSQSQKNAWHQFALASFLLGTNGNDFFEFTDDNSVSGIIGTLPMDQVNVGVPTSNYGAVAGGAYARNFTRGVAVVNPGSSTVTVRLGTTLVGLDGVARTSVTLGPHAAAVLTGAGSPLGGLPPGNFSVGGGNPGYRLVSATGGVYTYGGEGFAGALSGKPLSRPVVGMAATPSRLGYWLVASDGGIFTFGGAGFYGSTGAMSLNRPIVGMAATPTGHGYWLVASDGGIFSFGDARFLGSTGAIPLNRSIVGMAATPSGNGYWLVASDGGIFSFGDAAFQGSAGAMPLNRPIVGMAATPSGNGYWLVASDGGIFSFGDAAFHGSIGGIHLNRPIVGMAATPAGDGYWLVASDGGVFALGAAPFQGSAGALNLAASVVGASS